MVIHDSVNLVVITGREPIDRIFRESVRDADVVITTSGEIIKSRFPELRFAWKDEVPSTAREKLSELFGN